MEPNKIDTKIREKLGSRELKPSEQAWDRLDAMLSLGENKKKKNYSWLYIAASLVFFTTIGFWFYNQNSEKIVIEDVKVVINDNSNTTKLDTLKSNQSSIKKEVNIFDNVEVIVENKSTEKTSKVIKVEEKIKEKNKSNYQINVLAENQNSEIVIEEVQEVKIGNKYVTAEMLLASVENRKVEKKEPLNKVTKSTLKVNTSSLLSSAEKELDVEYREDNLEKISRNFIQVKSALANRNYE